MSSPGTTTDSLPKPIPERINAIVTVLERLAADVEILREGTIALSATLPKGCEPHLQLLKEQAAALDRISIALGMVQHTAASIENTYQKKISA